MTSRGNIFESPRKDYRSILEHRFAFTLGNSFELFGASVTAPCRVNARARQRERERERDNFAERKKKGRKEGAKVAERFLEGDETTGSAKSWPGKSATKMAQRLYTGESSIRSQP